MERNVAAVVRALAGDRGVHQFHFARTGTVGRNLDVQSGGGNADELMETFRTHGGEPIGFHDSQIHTGIGRHLEGKGKSGGGTGTREKQNGGVFLDLQAGFYDNLQIGRAFSINQCRTHIEKTRTIRGHSDGPIQQTFTSDGKHVPRPAQAERECFGFSLMDVEGEVLIAGDFREIRLRIDFGGGGEE